MFLFIEYLKISRDEWFGATAMSVFLIVDLDFVGYVDVEEFKCKVVYGLVDLDSLVFCVFVVSECVVG